MYRTTLASTTLVARVNLTGGNRSGPVPVSTGIQSAKIQNLNLNLKNEKIPKNPKNTSRCDEFNGIKFSQKFVHLV